MAHANEFVEYVTELMQPMGPVQARAMFGGYGIYLDDVMFALVADDTLYFKAGDGNRGDFAARGLPPFIYGRGRKRVVTSYHQAPPEALDNADDMCRWARGGYAAALERRQKSKKARSRS